MHRQRVIVLLLAAFGCAGAAVLPWARISYIGTVHGTDGPGGFATIFAFAVAGLLALLPGWKDPLDSGTRTFAGLLGLAVTAWAVYLIVKVQRLGSELGSTIDHGLWVILVSGAAVAVASFAKFSLSKRRF